MNFKICRRCEFCEYHAEEYEDSGVLTTMPSVSCNKAEEVLLMNSELPEVCHLFLEHRVSCQEISPSIANSLSGGKPIGEEK